MAKAGSAEIDAIFQKCSKFFGEMARMCDSYLGKNSKWKGSRKKGERKAKFPKDPDAPKKPVTAYILYFKDRKQLYVDQNQNLPITDITKLIGKEWKELPKERQQIYIERANKDKERYAKENESYKLRKKKEAEPEEVEEVSQKNKKKLHKLSEIKHETKKEASEEEEEEAEEEEVEAVEEVEEEDHEEVEEEDDDRESVNGKSKRGNFLATSSDNELDEKIKKKPNSKS